MPRAATQLESWEREETAARWHPDIGWFCAHLCPEAILQLKDVGRVDD